MTFDLIQYVEEEAESRGERGMITEISVIGGWLALASGVPSDKRFFPFKTKEESDAARRQALGAVEEGGWTNSAGKKASVSMAVRLSIFGGDSVLGREEPVTWERIDSHMVTFGKAYKDVFVGMSYPHWYDNYVWGDKIYAHLLRAVDPDRPTYTDSEGNVRDNYVNYIAATYENKEAASQAAYALQNDGAYIDIPPCPDKYLYGDWEKFYIGMVEEYKKDNPNDADFHELEDFGVTQEILDLAKQQAKELLEAQDIPF